MTTSKKTAKEQATGELEIRGGNELGLPGAISATHWEIPADVSFEPFMSALPKLNAISQSVKWYRGEWLLFGEGTFGERISQALEADEAARKTLENEAWVAKKVPIEVRYPPHQLSWSHHRSVASLDPKDQKAFLGKAVKNRWTRRELDEAIREWKRKQKAEKAEKEGEEEKESETKHCCNWMEAKVSEGIVTVENGDYHIALEMSEPERMSYCLRCGTNLIRKG